MQAKTCHQDVLKLNNRSRGGINFVSYIPGRKPSIFQILWLFHDCNHNHGKSSSNPFIPAEKTKKPDATNITRKPSFIPCTALLKTWRFFGSLAIWKKIKLPELQSFLSLLVMMGLSPIIFATSCIAVFIISAQDREEQLTSVDVWVSPYDSISTHDCHCSSHQLTRGCYTDPPKFYII